MGELARDQRIRFHARVDFGPSSVVFADPHGDPYEASVADDEQFAPTVLGPRREAGGGDGHALDGGRGFDRDRPVHPVDKSAAGVGQIDLDPHRPRLPVLEAGDPGNAAAKHLAAERVDPDFGVVARVDEGDEAIGDRDDDLHLVGPGKFEHRLASAVGGGANEAAGVDVPLGHDPVEGGGDAAVADHDLGLLDVGGGDFDGGVGGRRFGFGEFDSRSEFGPLGVGDADRLTGLLFGCPGDFGAVPLFFKQGLFDRPLADELFEPFRFPFVELAFEDMALDPRLGLADRCRGGFLFGLHHVEPGVELAGLAAGLFEQSFSPLELLVDFGDVEFGEQVALLHLAADVDVDGAEVSRDFRVDVCRLERLDRPRLHDPPVDPAGDGTDDVQLAGRLGADRCLLGGERFGRVGVVPGGTEDPAPDRGIAEAEAGAPADDPEQDHSGRHASREAGLRELRLGRSDMVGRGEVGRLQSGSLLRERSRRDPGHRVGLRRRASRR